MSFNFYFPIPFFLTLYHPRIYQFLSHDFHFIVMPYYFSVVFVFYSSSFSFYFSPRFLFFSYMINLRSTVVSSRFSCCLIFLHGGLSSALFETSISCGFYFSPLLVVSHSCDYYISSSFFCSCFPGSSRDLLLFFIYF